MVPESEYEGWALALMFVPFIVLWVTHLWMDTEDERQVVIRAIIGIVVSLAVMATIREIT